MPEQEKRRPPPPDVDGGAETAVDRDREELREALRVLGETDDEGDRKESDTSDFEPDSELESEEAEDEEEAFNEEELLKDNSRDANIRLFTHALDSPDFREMQDEEDRDLTYFEDNYDFPEDPENWTEEDLQEFWADAPVGATKPGWDPVWADEDDWGVMRDEIDQGRDPPIAPFYVPYRKYYPVIPDNHHDISNAKSVIEELDRTEEFLQWVSYIFPNGSSYEGTVWDDLAHGKGVYVAEPGLVRYEGEWFRNAMEGHGVVEVDIPDIQPVSGSKLEAKMRAEGKIISTDFMSPEDKKWLEMDVEDSIRLAGDHAEIPFYENDEWINIFGEKPEKGRYKYAGQWKHGRMHGCGVYEVNERILYGRFYFGEYLDDSTGCDADISALHAGIAEVAAAKARMFVNKPDGMVREYRGPYGDPQHPYLYEEDDVWMAPGFINQFYEVPDYWRAYVEEVDQERDMWLNSFYKAPLRIPMPAELEYWWETDDSPEFVLINKEPGPDPEDPSKLVYTEDPLIFHTRTGRLINYVDDEKDGIRLFWQPPLKDGEDVDPEKVQFLPLGFDSYYGREKRVPKKNWLSHMITSVENTVKPMLDRVGKWADERKKQGEMNLKLINQELELVEAEICLEEELEDLERALKKKQNEEEKAVQQELETSALQGVDEIESDEGEVEDEEAHSSFGRVFGGDDAKSRNNAKKSPFSSLSLSIGSTSVMLAVWDEVQSGMKVKHGISRREDERVCSVSYPRSVGGRMMRLGSGGRRIRSSRDKDSRCRLNGLARILWRSGMRS